MFNREREITSRTKCLVKSLKRWLYTYVTFAVPSESNVALWLGGFKVTVDLRGVFWGKQWQIYKPVLLYIIGELIYLSARLC